MQICRLFVRTFIMAFFAINAWNMFNHASSRSEGFKRSLTEFEASLKTRIWPGYQNQASTLLSNHAPSVVYYGALVQLIFSILGVWCSFSGSVAALVFFLFQVLAQNFAKIDFKNSLDLERYALPVSLFFAVIAVNCCSKSSCAKTRNEGSKSGNQDSNLQSSQKKRH